jgi:hypothetical protein
VRDDGAADEGTRIKYAPAQCFSAEIEHTTGRLETILVHRSSIMHWLLLISFNYFSGFFAILRLVPK